MVAGRTIRRLSPDEIDERRRNGQCFNCGEKYVRGHSRVCARLFHLEIHEADEEDLPEDPVEQPHISLIVIAGVRTRDTMQAVVRFGAVTVTALLDSGSTHNFVSAPAAARCGLCFIPRDNISVTVANGDKVPATDVFRDAAFSIDVEAFCADFFVLTLGGYDMVLGTDWLATLGPILWDFGRHTMSFWRHNHLVCWRGVMSSPRHPAFRRPAPGITTSTSYLTRRRWLCARTDIPNCKRMSWNGNAAHWSSKDSYAAAHRRSPRRSSW
jgi:hypothetical protein